MELLDNGAHNSTYGKTVKGYNYVAGKEQDAADGKRFQSTNPSDHNDIVGDFPLSGKQDVVQAINAAEKAFLQWREVPAPVRANIIGRVGEILKDNKDNIAFLMTREMGKTLKEARGSVQEAIDTAQFFQSEGRRLYGQTVPSEMRHKELFTYRRPKGVVGVITPSNFPIAVASWKIIPALLCGNVVVWKTPPEAPTVAYIFTKIFHDAGLPTGVLNTVHGDGEVTGQALVDEVNSGRIHKISFTGSTKVGRMIGEVCGRNLIIPSLELGGKNPLIVMDDADLDQAVEGALWSTYGTAGQRCTSCGNIILHDKIYNDFKTRFLKAIETIKIGNPIQHPDVLYGPMICERYEKNFLAHIDIGLSDGATLLYCGKDKNPKISKSNLPSTFLGDPETGFFCWPTLWENVTTKMRLCVEEVFGPTTNLVRVHSLDEAIKVANTPNYGLSSAIYTQTRSNVITFKENIQAGMSSINNSTTGAEAHLPFGGVKGSGNGTRESGIWVIDAYTYWHAVNDDLSGGLQLAQMDTEQLEKHLATDYNMLRPQ